MNIKAPIYLFFVAGKREREEKREEKRNYRGRRTVNRILLSLSLQLLKIIIV